jgi:hypothetical protein
VGARQSPSLDFLVAASYLNGCRSCLPNFVTALTPLTTIFRSKIDTRALLLRQERPNFVND